MGEKFQTFEGSPEEESVSVIMSTSLGDIELMVYPQKAPLSAGDFLNYVDRGSDGGYAGTFIHRSVPGFVVQGGGYIFNPADGSSGCRRRPCNPRPWGGVPRSCAGDRDSPDARGRP